MKLHKLTSVAGSLKHNEHRTQRVHPGYMPERHTKLVVESSQLRNLLETLLGMMLLGAHGLLPSHDFDDVDAAILSLVIEWTSANSTQHLAAVSSLDSLLLEEVASFAEYLCLPRLCCSLLKRRLHNRIHESGESRRALMVGCSWREWQRGDNGRHVLRSPSLRSPPIFSSEPWP